MSEPAEELKLEHQHRPVERIKVDIADAFAHGEEVKARRKTMLAGIKEESDGVKDTLEHLGEELRRTENALRVVRMEVPND
jgi:hypothetical protein